MNEVLKYLPTLYDNINLFSLYFLRISTFLFTFMVFHKELITARIVLALGFILAVFAYFAAPPQITAIAINEANFIYLSFLQFLIGFAASLLLNLQMSLFLTFGQFISSQIGLSIVNLFDPQMGILTSLSKFYVNTGILLFFLLNGHLYVIDAIMASFKYFPMHELVLSKHFYLAPIAFLSTIFKDAIFLAMSVTLIILFTNIALAIVTKFAPQFNLFSVGININLILGLTALVLTFGIFLQQSEQMLGVGLKQFAVSFLGKSYE